VSEQSIVVVGGTSGLGREVAQHYADRGADVVITGRDAGRAESIASEIGGSTRGVAADLAVPQGIAAGLAGVGRVDRLVLAAIQRDSTTVREYEIEPAIRLATLKLVGYTEVVHALVPELHDGSAILLFGGVAGERPYPGSTTVTSVNGAVDAMVRTLAIELAPIRVNAIHPGIVGDSPAWADKDLSHVVARTPTGRITRMRDVVGAVEFLLENEAMNGVSLHVNGGTLLM
jgi:NAD(P)-dependent dehydrogenase (short-subunit alcohol dehydrogenase family)